MTRLHLPLLLAAALVLPSLAQAQEPAAVPPPRINVTGEGEAAIAPDMAIVTLAVLREAETARAALDANNEAMADVIAAMKEAGIADRDLQTAGLSIQPRYVYPENGQGEPRITGYQVANTLTLRVRELSALGSIIDRSVTLGVNQGGDITFTNDDPAAATSEARRRAVEDALQRAQTLAEAAGVELGEIVTISERTEASPPVPLGRQMMRMEAADAAVPIAAGENLYQVRVDVSFELVQ